jgi:hypothetical protein
MSKTAFVLAFLALALAGWTSYQQCGAREELTAVLDGQQALDTRLAALERGLATLRDAPAPAEPLTAPSPSPTPDAEGPALAGTARPGPRPASVEQRLAKLEQESAARAKPAAASDGPQIAFEGAEGGAPVTFSFGPQNWIGNVNQATKKLGLDDSQTSGLERVVEDVKRELDALHQRPNEEGLTMKQLQDEFKPGDAFGEEAMAGLHEHMAKMAKFRASKVPGTNETYAQAERRIKKDGKARARSYLSADQAKTWDKSHTDGLFGGGGEHMAASVMVMDAPPVFDAR